VRAIGCAASAAESYLDTGNRHHFANLPGLIALHPDFAAHSDRIALIGGMFGYAPPHLAGGTLTAVRERLAERVAETSDGASRDNPLAQFLPLLKTC
jgi:hypothetical protein